MLVGLDQSAAPTAIRVDRSAIFVSLELGKSTWLDLSITGERQNVPSHGGRW